jgi:membrane-bound ClpP family serine protease
MTDPSDGFERRARMAAAELRRATAIRPPDLGEVVTVRKIARVGVVVLVVAAIATMGAVAFALGTVADPAALRWGTAVILLVLLVGTGLLCAHAGGHAWFVPLPALALAVVWAFTASARSSEAGWWLVALSAIACAGGVLLAGSALRQRLRGTVVGLPPLRGTTGIAITELTPAGVVRVGGENWSAESVSGILPAGAPVHVLGVRGVRLDVWSEAGTVTDHTVFDTRMLDGPGLDNGDTKEEDKP